MINAATKLSVRRRAGGRCEYCHLPEAAADAPFHVEHVRAKQHGGGDDEANLALACDRCNLHKGPNITAFDPDTDAVVLLFHPRRDRWQDHFRFDGPALVGLTPTGRAAVRLLNMNAPQRVRLRDALMRAGEMPGS